MIQLLDRQEILNLNKVFAAFLVGEQDTKYNPILDHNKYEPSEMYVEDSNSPRFVSQEECDRWNEEALKDYQKRKDNIEPVSIKEKYRAETIYKFREPVIDKYIDKLADGLFELSNRLEWKSVIFLLDYSTPWLHQKNEYKPVKKSLDYLRQLGVDENFVGGFKASGDELKEFIKNLFWIIRCNASLPICHFSGIDTDFAANICDYGSIHFYFYSDIVKDDIEKTAGEIGMIEVKDGNCIENFSERGEIKGQELVK